MYFFGGGGVVEGRLFGQRVSGSFFDVSCVRTILGIDNNIFAALAGHCKLM